MNASKIQLLSKPKLSNPIFILGLDDQYGINNIVTQTLIEHTRSEKFAGLYSPHFPDYAIAEETGLCHLPTYDFYASALFNPNTVILSGDIVPDPDDSQAHYEVLDLIVSFARDLDCRRFLSFGTYHAESAEDRIRIATTTERLTSTVTRKLGGSSFARGRIDGLTGMILGLAKLQKLQAICVLAPYGENISPEDTAQAIYHYVLDLLALD